MPLKSAKSIADQKYKPKDATITFKNNSKNIQYVNGIELTFDSYFTLFGTVEIYVGDEKLLSDNNAEDFKQYRVFSVPTNSIILKPYESIKIFIWNPLTDDTITLSANIELGDVPAISTLSGQAIDHDSILSEISGGAGNEADTHDIFPFEIYRDITREFLINTKGRQNMLLTMASSTIEPPKILPDTFPVDEPPAPLEIQLIQTSYQPTTGANSWFRQSYELRCDNVLQNPAPYTTQYLLIDFLNTNRKNIIFTMMSDTPNIEKYIYNYLSAYYTTGRETTNRTYTDLIFEIINSIKHIVEASDDITFETGVIQLDEFDFLGIQYTKQYPDLYKRYVRIREVISYTTPSPNNLELAQQPNHTPLYHTPSEKSMIPSHFHDELVHGGIAKLSFKLKGVNDQWFTILNSEELGSITEGQSKLIQYNIAGIPPSQSRFKAVLEVVGSLKTGVTIDLVA